MDETQIPPQLIPNRRITYFLSNNNSSQVESVFLFTESGPTLADKIPVTDESPLPIDESVSI